MKITVHIGELVLEGYEPGDRHSIGSAVEHELARLVTERGLPSSLQGGFEAPRHDRGTMSARQGDRPDAVGRQVAGAVFQGLDL